MQGIPEQNTVGLPAYVGRMGGIRVLFVEDDEVYCANLLAELSERVDFIDKARGVEILPSRLRLVSETGKPEGRCPG